jgi:hypothetical protein
MVSTEVQRTLVKSPPELWAELSDPELLARHLGELGEVRITRTEPETRIEWEAGETCGTVLLEASGWGTRVKLTADHELRSSEPASVPEPASTPAELTSAPAAEAASAVAVAAAPQLSPAPPAPIITPAEEPEAAPSPGPTAAPEPTGAAAAPEPTGAAAPEPTSGLAFDPPRIERRGFFVRLFSRRKREEPDTQDVAPRVESERCEPVDYEPVELPSVATFAAVRGAIAPDACAAAHPFAEPTTRPEQQASADLAGELRAAEEIAAEHVTAVLAGLLDRLGAAHHRPFSRA